jgi:YD repeat-containing protein
MTNPPTKILLLGLLTLALMTGAASAQQRTIYDASGKRLGSATTDSQGTTTNYDARGKINA